jgi:hypothetical protein
MYIICTIYEEAVMFDLHPLSQQHNQAIKQGLLYI